MRTGRGGFSLIELLVVIGIAAALLAWSYPRLAVLVSKYRLDGAAWNLATDLQKIRLRAIGEGSRFDVVFDAANKTYQVRKEIGGVFTNQGAALRIEDAGVVALSATANPVFNPRGAVENPATLTLTGPAGGIRLIFVQLPGRIHVQ